ncbi:hypothetical protein [Thermoactinomyces sp. CICC 10523]|uniref:hypothetical protein n=1 Tax=Thermoactinomyces sp. CICC 10523 TaxID=2767428 RepID=UPI0018DE4237|nr:hypothetical protein [Thermoactinomyces sp. CICC 10523]MBH8598136.1 hypothetical protein [Thermoactinomyces sp. CICC 10523]
MFRFRFILVLVLGLLLLSAACSRDALPLRHARLAVIYTNAAKKESALMLLDAKGEAIGEIPIKAMGIFQIEKSDKNGLLLPERFGRSLIILSPEGKLRTEQTKEFPIFVKQRDGVTVSAFNTTLHSNTLEIVQNNQRKQLQLPGFLRTATWDDTYVYVFSSLIEAKRAVLYVVDRQRGKVAQTVPLAIDLADDLKIVGHDLLIPSTDEQKKMAIYDLEKKRIRYIELPFAKPQYILPVANEIWITHKQQAVLTVLDPDADQVKRTLAVSQPIFQAKQDAQHLYILSQSDSAETAGVLGVYDKKHLHQIKRISLPRKGEMRIQDFALLP